MKPKFATSKNANLKTIIKRDGSKVPFNPKKITNAVTRALQETKEYRPGVAEKITDAVVRKLALRKSYDKKNVPIV